MVMYGLLHKWKIRPIDQGTPNNDTVVPCSLGS